MRRPLSAADQRVGIDIEILQLKKQKGSENKFLTQNEQTRIYFLHSHPSLHELRSLSFGAGKESVYKWYGDGGVDFRHHIRLTGIDEKDETVICSFAKTKQQPIIHYRHFDHFILTWIVS